MQSAPAANPLPVVRPKEDRAYKPTTAQSEVIGHRRGALIVISGAGSGKTSTISERTAAMVLDGIPMNDQLLLTFSRKAVEELTNRITARIPGVQTAGQINTFHGFGWRFIRRFPLICQRAPGVTLLDDLDQWKVFQSAGARTGVVAEISDRHLATRMLRMIRGTYSLIRNDELGPPDVMVERMRARLNEEDSLPPQRIQKAVETALEYENLMRQGNLVDYDQLVLLPAQAMRRNEKACLWLQRKFPYLTVDESQDTNRVQYELVRSIGGHGNVVCVGDDDQVLFTWRGARSANLHQFHKEFGAKAVYLVQNWRSTPAIVQAAARLIEHNTGRMPKTPFASGAPGSPPRVARTRNGYDMARGIARSIQSAIEKGTSPGEIAVLYRTNRMSKLLETDLRRAGVPYRMVGNHSLFEAPEIRALLGAIRLRTNSKDQMALQRVGRFMEGVGESSLTAVAEWAAEQDGNPYTCEVARSTTGMPKRPATAYARIHAAMRSLESYGPAKVGAWALADDGLGLEAYYSDKPEKEAEFRRMSANMSLFDDVNAATIEKLPADDTDAWAAITENVLNDSAPETQEEADARASGSPMVTLSTIHRAKGLEWDIVFVAGATDGIMPLRSAMEDEADDVFAGGLEEERRLAYVAVTRARKHCVLAHADELMLPGMKAPEKSAPSPFLTEMGLEIPPIWKPQPMRVEPGDKPGSLLSLIR